MLWLKDTQSKNSIMYNFGPVLGPEVCSTVERTGKVEIPAGAKKEAELTFLHEIVNNVEKFQIPSSLVLNLDQTNSKYVSMGKTAMAETVQIPFPSLA